MNFLLDRDAEGWASDLARLKTKSGACDTTAPIESDGMLTGEFTWRCERGRISRTLLLAPTRPARIQALRLSRVMP